MSLDACAGLVERGDPDRFLATMTAPVPAREILFPIYAFNLEVARAPWVSQEPLIAEMRLQFWRDALDEIATGKPARAHEVAQPLAEALRGAPGAGRDIRAVTDALGRVVTGHRTDIAREPFAHDEALWHYIDETAGSLAWAGALALGTDPACEGQVRAAARAQGLANWLLSWPEVAAHGWQAHPAEGHGALIGRALDELAAARRGMPRSALPVLRAGWRAPAVLARAKAQPDAIAAGTLGGSEFGRRGALLVKSLTGGW